MMTLPQQTPIEKLLTDKQRIQQSCKEHEQRIGQSVSYIQENAGTLLLSGISSLLFPSKTSSKTDKPATSAKVSTTDSSSSGTLGLSDFLSMGKALLPVAWEVIQPILISWSIRTAKKKLLGLFKSKKRKPIEKRKV